MHHMFHDFSCVDGVCVEVDSYYTDDQLVEDCDDGDPCTIDTCVDGQCTHILLQPVANAGDDVPINSGQSTELDGSASYIDGGCEDADGYIEYRWSIKGGAVIQPWSIDPTVSVSPTATTTYTLEIRCSALLDCTDSDDVVVTVRPIVPPAARAAGCPSTKYLTVDWEGCNTSKPLYSNDKLAVDLLGPSPDSSDSLFLGRGTHAPVVDERTYYLIVVRELEDIPPVPENYQAIVVLNVTPADAEFNKDILLTVGLNQTQLPANASNLTMDYYDDVNGVWVPLEYEAGGPNAVAELTLSAPINHFSIYGILAELAPTPTPPAHFVATGLLDPVLSVEKIWETVTFVTKIGQTVTITATITNDGGQSGTYPVELKLDGETVDTQTVTLGAGQSQQVSFTPQSGLDYGQHKVEVGGLSREFTTSRTITWWLIIVIIVAIGLIIWGVVWGRRRRKAHQAAE